MLSYFTTRPSNSRPVPPSQAGLLVTEELDSAIERCKKKVNQISQECRRLNRRFRDLEFDFIEDRHRCLHCLDHPELPPTDPNHTKPKYNPADVRRVTDIFEEPQFFVNGATPSDIRQGLLGDCWFLSALAVIGTPNDELIEKICVHRDEQVGVYGFIFFRDNYWQDVIIDDLLFTKFPPWESLSPVDQQIHHNDKVRYEKHTRKGGKNLYFARSNTENETWLPLIEKAYAKLHGDYESLEGGYTGEGAEDLTGGVSALIYTKDILDPSRFWSEELMRVGHDRVFACFTRQSRLDTDEGYVPPPIVRSTNGLIMNHAYSVIRAVECKGRRFLRVRNPWGETEWTGRWADGSKEWADPFATELKAALKDFVPGDDGEFIMEYDDFLSSWGIIERARLFDEKWRMSSQWLKFDPTGKPGHTWSHGDVSFTLDVPKDTPAVLVLAQLDDRYFDGLDGDFFWSLDFTLFEENSDVPLASSVHSRLWDRSVKLECDSLKAGNYVIQVRVDWEQKDPNRIRPMSWDRRKYVRTKTELLRGQCIAANFDHGTTDIPPPFPPDLFRGQSVTRMELDAQEELRKHRQMLRTRFGSPVTTPTAALLPAAAGSPVLTASPRQMSVVIDQGRTISASQRTMSNASEQDEPEEAFKSAQASLDDITPRENMATRDDRVVSIEVPAAEEVFRMPGSLRDDSRRSTTPDDSLNVSGSSPVRPRPITQIPPVQTHQVYYNSLPPPLPISGSGAYRRPQVVCSGCGNRIYGKLYKCTELVCVRYILCDICHEKGQHEKTHVFMESSGEVEDDFVGALEAPPMRPPSVVKVLTLPDLSDELVIGLKVYTHRDSQAIVRGQLRMGNAIRKNAFRTNLF